MIGRRDRLLHVLRRLVTLTLTLALGCGPGSVSGDGETGECLPIEEKVAVLEAPDLCESYFQDFPFNHQDPTFGQPPREFEVEIVNARDEPILLIDQGWGCKHPARWFSLAGEHQGRTIWLPPSNCHYDWPSCASTLDNNDGCHICASLYWPIYIAPGGRFRTTWPAAVLIDVELPASCSADGEAVACWAPTALPPGEYQLEAVAATLSECEDEYWDCTCEIDEHGSCVVLDAYLYPSFSTSTTWTAGCNPIELRFE
jgi:hypothetical protein